MKKLVIAYSGGLDTSYCAVSLSKQGYEVHAVSVNTGGFSSEEIKKIEHNAYTMGLTTYKNINAVTDYYDKVIKYLIFGNVLKNNTYPLSVSAERIIQAIEIVNYAKSIGASYIAHGSTGAGNDQVRFDMIFQTIAPEIEIITPIRDLQLSRQEEIEYLKSNGIDLSWEKAKYSVNKGLWGTSVGGEETLTSEHPLPEHAYPSQVTKTVPEQVKLSFVKGELMAINDDEKTPVQNIEQLNTMASKFGIGRDIHVGDTIVGIKGRVGFEAAAALITIKAHHLLEKHTLTKWQLQHKEYLASFYGMHLHEGQYLDPVMRDMEAFFTNSQAKVTGDVFVTLKLYHFTLDGIDSPHDLMNAKFGSYGELNKGWTAEDAKGFIKILGNQNKIYQQVNQ
ncbi:argininosuccinate synthase [Tenacibaculum mesophilum]|uniref:argininosuccinate synthase n=1 Tax=Tenacibaculum mesophilum TaxID=104268 RepID=A0ABN5T300_9FLAO|nr:argininosuccinate synthase domain-containing protein [Tenacibaculum mesophilum]GFD93173.1 argininosuccinate synthase [Alteromonas sp. KUL154]GFD98290.1 argininosuccinate synthase [Alteromonas sp. KUL156]AZJ31478.1 argininosuccinate synthase [Tenacibaculum mesophilum]QFS29528.1 argininosuccinate synthase [Tenacibaculum mesophilum]SHF95076.1 argininosuccinate synthase [Tenacibaculum mesophilum]